MMFFSIDGGDGTGKTTQAALLCEWLRARGHDVAACRDPGGLTHTPDARTVSQGRHFVCSR